MKSKTMSTAAWTTMYGLLLSVSSTAHCREAASQWERSCRVNEPSGFAVVGTAYSPVRYLIKHGVLLHRKREGSTYLGWRWRYWSDINLSRSP
jgi:hypothetical protein